MLNLSVSTSIKISIHKNTLLIIVVNNDILEISPKPHIYTSVTGLMKCYAYSCLLRYLFLSLDFGLSPQITYI